MKMIMMMIPLVCNPSLINIKMWSDVISVWTNKTTLQRAPHSPSLLSPLSVCACVFPPVQWFHWLFTVIQSVITYWPEFRVQPEGVETVQTAQGSIQEDQWALARELQKTLKTLWKEIKIYKRVLKLNSRCLYVTMLGIFTYQWRLCVLKC